MKRIVLLLLCLLPLLAVAQSVTVPTTIDFGGVHLRLTDGGRRAVQEKVDALRRYQPSFQARVDLADAYFPIIDRVFKEKGIPLDFHYLSLQESGLQGDAESIHAAVGYWQFKRESAVELGVQVNDMVDERKHITVSTYGAAQYLLRNNGVLHNWVNTLLTYNLGLSGAKPYTLPTDYNATEMEITQDTHPYIITFLAHKIAYEPAIGQNPNPPMVLQEYPALSGQTLSALATNLQTEPSALAKHNHWLLDRKVPSDRAYTVLVPVTDPIQLTAMAARQNQGTKGQLLETPETDPKNADFVRINGLRALIALPGDTKESLARRADLKMRRFMNFNDLMAFDNIVVGQPYFVQKKRDKAAVAYHTAQPGESVASVSQKYGVRVRAILNKNRMARNEELRPGRVLWLQHTRPRDVPVEYAPSTDVVAQAAFERPVSRPTTKAAPAAPSSPKAKETQPEPYAGNIAVHNRMEEDAAEEDSVTMTSGDLATENLNDLPSASTTDSSATAAPEADPAPAPARAPRTVYTGRPAQSTPTPVPTEAPIITEPVVAAEPAPTPATPAQTAAKKAPATAVQPSSAPAPSATTPKPATQPKPTTAAPADAAAAPLAVPVATEELPANGLYIVQKSEGIYAIARRYGLRPADVIAWNELPPNPPLRLGQTLRLTPPPGFTPTAPAATPAPVPTVSSAGAAPKPAPAVVSAPKPTASAPTSKVVTSPPAPTTPASRPAPAPDPVTPSSAVPASNVVRHTVEAKESMYSISRKYKVTIKQIMEWNNKPDFNVKPGEVLIVQPGN